ncbi:MAG: transposase [Lachnospiraceae bacterium]|nr:transposase [Lachnospiraceae bacterium]
MNRGIRRMDIFSDNMDRQVFLELLKISLHRHGCILHAYCLMTNHIHLLLETSDVKVGKFMQYVTCCYSMYFNEKYRYHGHLFEGRYKSCLVKDDRYFLQTSRYIHLNPVKAKITEYPENYVWSSYRTMIGISDDKITDTIRTLSYFPVNNVLGYRAFVEDTGNNYMVQEREIGKRMDDL